jgi:hypothetical protein
MASTQHETNITALLQLNAARVLINGDLQVDGNIQLGYLIYIPLLPLD